MFRLSRLRLLAVAAVLIAGALTFGVSAAFAAFHGIAFAKTCEDPTAVGDPMECAFNISNFDFGNNPEVITSLSDTVNSAGGAVPSGELLSTLQLFFNPATGPNAPTCTGGSGSGVSGDPYVGATSCTLPTFASTITTGNFSHYNVQAADFGLPGHQLTDQGSLGWHDTCTVDPVGCNTGNQVATAPGSTTVTQLTSSTATEIRNGGGQAVTVVQVGTTVHDFVTVTGQPGSPAPSGNVTIDWFLNGSCSGNPQVTSAPLALDANGQLDATGFAFTVNTPGQRAFLAHYAGDNTYTGSDGPCEPLQVVDAYIEISPPEATNPVNTIHTYTASVFVNDGLGGGYVAAPDGTLVTFTLLPGSVGNFTGGNTCLTAGGSCTIDTTSPNPGDDTMQASTTLAVAGVTMTRTTGQTAPGHPNSGNAIKHWIAGGKHLAFKGSMEGALHWLPGSFVNGGYHFWLSQKNPTPVTVTITGTIDVPVHCGGPNVNPPVGTISVPVSIAPFTIPANSTAKYLTADQNNILSWMGAVASPDLCGGGLMYNSEGAMSNLNIVLSPHVGVLNLQWHYRIPAAKGKPNTDCTNAADPNRDRADVCGASWSATKDP